MHACNENLCIFITANLQKQTQEYNENTYIHFNFWQYYIGLIIIIVSVNVYSIHLFFFSLEPRQL